MSTTLKSIENLCAEYEDLPHDSTVFRWMHQHPEFRGEYLAAKETQGVKFAESLLSAAHYCPADTNEIAKQNHIFRVGQWHYSKLAPKQFGDKKEVKQEMNLNIHEQDLAHLK